MGVIERGTHNGNNYINEGTIVVGGNIQFEEAVTVDELCRRLTEAAHQSNNAQLKEIAETANIKAAEGKQKRDFSSLKQFLKNNIMSLINGIASSAAAGAILEHLKTLGIL